MSDELAALREENARLTERAERLLLEASTARLDRDHLRAHVAALVHELRHAHGQLQRYVYRDERCRQREEVLNRPDLAALAAAAQAREAVVKAVREEVLADAHAEDWPACAAAIAALDAARGKE